MKYQLIISSDDPAELAKLLMGTSGAAVSVAYTGPGSTAAAPVAAVEPDEGPASPYVPGEVDVNGIPWHESIHTSTHAKNADGSWRRKRGVDDATFAAVTASLRGAAGAPVNAAPVAAPVAFAPTAAVPMPAAPAAYVAPVAAPAPVAVAAPVAAPAPAPAPAAAAAPGAVDFPTLMQIVGNGVQSGKINTEYMTWLGATYGFGTNIGAVAGNAELIGRIYAQLQVDGRL